MMPVLRKLLPAFLAGALLLLFFAADRLNSPVQVLGTYHNDRPMWDHLLRALPPLEMPVEPRGAIIPHHALVARQLGSFYAGLAQRIQPKIIYILCPNHYETTPDAVVVAGNVGWETVYGRLASDPAAAEELVSLGLARRHDVSFRLEHGIYIHAPFIKHHFPDAKIVPILFRWKNSREQNKEIAAWLAARWKEESFVLASVDFSHYQPAPVADFHDEATRLSIEGWHLDALYEREVDSPSSLFTLMTLMETLGAQKAERLMHTNSDRVKGMSEAQTTSHHYYVFSEGPPAETSHVSVLVGGPQVQPDRRLASQVFWEWKREAPPLPRAGDWLADLRGMEDRFLTGTDVYLFDPPGDPVSRYKLPWGNLSVVWMTDESLAARNWQAVVREEALRSFVVVVQDTLAPTNMEFLYSLVDAGASAVLRRGPGPIGWETRGKAVVLTGMGAFIGQPGKNRGVMAGLVLGESPPKVWTFPILVEDGYPKYAFE